MSSFPSSASLRVIVGSKSVNHTLFALSEEGLEEVERFWGGHWGSHILGCFQFS